MVAARPAVGRSRAVRHAGRVEQERGRSAERLVAFTDAVVAIAITLLVLPLIEIPEGVGKEGLAALVADEGWLRYLGFGISFFVIARLWWGHHRIFAHVVRWSPGLVRLNILWLFTIAVLPVATALSTSATPGEHADVVGAYLGTMAVSSALLTAMAVLVLRRPDLTDGQDDQAFRRTLVSADTTAGFVLALVIATVFPKVHYFALLVLAFTGQVGALIARRHERRRPA